MKNQTGRQSNLNPDGINRNRERLKRPVSQSEEELQEMLKAYGFPKFVRNYQANDERRWTIDFVWRNGLDCIGVEVHGGYRGTVHKEVARNSRKSNWHLVNGWKILHATPDMISDGSLMMDLFELLDKAGGFIKWVIIKPGNTLAPQNKKLRRFYYDWILSDEKR